MMQVFFKKSSGYMRHHRMKLLSIVGCLFVMCSAPFAMAVEYLNLRPNQSRTINIRESVDTVFVSNPAIADYRLIDEHNIVVYAKSLGVSEITLYDNSSKILNKITIDVDPITAGLVSRIKSIYPTADIQIRRLTDPGSSSKATYLITGEVPDEETADIIYQIVGESVGVADDTQQAELNTQTSGAEGESGGTSEESSSSSSSGTLWHMRTLHYRNVLRQFTYPNKKVNQVNVQLTVVEVSKEFTDSLGISWSQFFTDPAGDTTGLDNGTFKLYPFVSGSAGFNAKNIVGAINALKDDDIAKVLAQPNLSVVSGETGNFLVGGEVPITVRDTSNNSVSTTYKSYGIMLAIAPKVLSDQRIRLTISNEMSSVVESTLDTESPRFDTRRSTSTIELADGQSFVIAGLLRDEERETLSKIPLIGDIPILGALARSASTVRKKTELVVFATVNLVKPVNSVSDIEIPVFNKTNSANLFFNVGVDRKVRENRLMNEIPLENKAMNFLDRGGFDK